MKIYVALLLIALLAACTPASSGMSDADKKAAMIANINSDCSGSSQDWCVQINGATAGQPDVAVNGQLVIVATGLDPTNTAAASVVCHNVASFTHDSNGKVIGFTRVTVISGGSEITSCGPP